MADLPDIHCWITVRNDSTGNPIPDGGEIFPPAKATVKYFFANESDKSVGPLWVVGALSRNGVRVKPAGQPNVVPAQMITLKPYQIWKQEFAISESAGVVDYEARILGDVGSLVNEEDEANNRDKRRFRIFRPPA